MSKRRVDMLVSPDWLAKYFGVDLAPGGLEDIRYDATAPGTKPGGQIRIPVLVDLPDKTSTDVVGIVRACELKTEKQTFRWLEGAGVQPWVAVKRNLDAGLDAAGAPRLKP